jgi:hypothetical protein
MLLCIAFEYLTIEEVMCTISILSVTMSAAIPESHNHSPRTALEPGGLSSARFMASLSGVQAEEFPDVGKG